ncbi:radical SAM/SPASM domain-containing protein [Streptomyces rimosus]|uniref:radical SAM/SPASM domain-containing protein n=1 Tax=Streptomyces rimosus TaxID=1927 RepID=UPI0009963065|nr:radical SAM protein [Streptomyces rimosus]
MPASVSTANTVPTLGFAWLEVTGKCDLRCLHCYADSSPQGTHGSMTVHDWVSVIDQLAAMGTTGVQFIGGEPCLYPGLPQLVAHARRQELAVEVFSNLTHVSADLWEVFTRYGVDLATSYYSDNAADHDAVTARRGSHTRTRANIEKAVGLGLNLRGGVISVRRGQRVEQAHQELMTLGLRHVSGDRTRAFGRASNGAKPTVADLCGECGRGKCAISPDGTVWPCVLSRFMPVGSVQERPLAEIWSGAPMLAARAELEAVHGATPAEACTPPQFLPMCPPCQPCVPSFVSCDPQAADETVASG